MDQGELGDTVVQPERFDSGGGQCFIMSRQTNLRTNAPDKK
jgi:hypothetical protein